MPEPAHTPLAAALSSDPISVIVVTAGTHDDCLRETLESVADQREQTELFVVGAHAQPGVPSAPSVACAVQEASHAHLGIVRAGAVYLPGALRFASAALRRNSDAELVYADALLIDEQGALRVRSHQPQAYTPQHFLSGLAPVLRSGALVRRSVVARFFSAPHAIDDDLGLWMRLVLGAKLLKLDRPVVAVRDEYDGVNEGAYECLIRHLRSGPAASWRLVQAARAGRRMTTVEHRARTRFQRVVDLSFALTAYPPTARAVDWSRLRMRRAQSTSSPGPRTGWEIAGVGSHDESLPLPPGAQRELTSANPRLRELKERYANDTSPRSVQSFWADDYRSRDLDLRYFRGDNAFLWQLRNVRSHAALRYQLYLRYLEEIDQRALLRTLDEDGAFGCWTFKSPGYPVVSRDLLDSVNELYFIHNSWGLFDRDGFSVLDIGAGYGRMAHRMTMAVPGLQRYYCTDGVAESTFLSEYYLRFRSVEKAQVVPVDEVLTLPTDRIDLCLNIHSFSETSLETIEAWVRLIEKLRIPRLMIVPNDPNEFLSYEKDHSRLDYAPLLREAGFELRSCQPMIRPDFLTPVIGMRDKYYWFERPDIIA